MFIPSREGAASLNDMKDMLANLPQYQEQREKVTSMFEALTVAVTVLILALVFVAS
jgi:hypothetical protein